AAAVERAREELDAARGEERNAVEEAARLGARREALARLDRDREGVEPVVRAVLALQDDGVHGPLADFIEGEADRIAPVEAYIGALTRAVVVRDRVTVARVVRWFESEWNGEGGLTLLALDGAPGRGGEEPLMEGIRAAGAGAPCVRALLAGVERLDGAPEGVPATVHRGVVRIGNPGGASGILERREQLRALEAEHERATAGEAHTAAARAAAQEVFDARQADLERARQGWRDAEDAHRKAKADLEAQAHQHGRMHRLRDELARQLEGARAARTRAVERGREAREQRAALLDQEAGLEAERTEARAHLERVQEAWETVRA